VNYVQNKTSKDYDGFMLYIDIDIEYAYFYYKTNGLLNGPQRRFDGHKGYVLEYFTENNTKCGDESYFYLDNKTTVVDTLPPCKTIW